MVALKAEVDISCTLYQRLQDDTIDLIVMPETFSDPEISSLPRVPYAAMYRNDRPFAFMALVATLAPSVCDFTRPFQG